MPLAWIHELSKQQLESLAGQLNLSTEETVDDLRKRVKDKWTTIEPYLPPHTSAKSLQTMKPIQSTTDPTIRVDTSVNNVKIKLTSDLIAFIPPIIDMNPKNILKFLIQVNHLFELIFVIRHRLPEHLVDSCIFWGHIWEPLILEGWFEQKSSQFSFHPVLKSNFLHHTSLTDFSLQRKT
jgi:hypothetical protein